MSSPICSKDVCNLIFLYLLNQPTDKALQDLKNARRVCRLWKRSVEENLPQIAAILFQRNEFSFPVRHKVSLEQHRCLWHPMQRRREVFERVSELAKQMEEKPGEFMDSVAVALQRCMIEVEGPHLQQGQMPDFPALRGHIHNPAYAYVYQNGAAEEGVHPAAVMLLYMIKGFESENPELRAAARGAFQKIVEEFSSHDSCLSTRYTLSVMVASLITGYLESSSDLRQAAGDILKIFHSNHALIQEVAALLPAGPGKHAIFFQLKQFMVKFSELTGERPVDWKQAIFATHPRSRCLSNLGKNMDRLHAAEITGQEEAIKTSVRCLIGLAQADGASFVNFSTPRGEVRNRYFPGLQAYLNQPQYAYVLNNNHAVTAKLRKASVCHLIRGLESDNLKIKDEALYGLSNLVDDYLKFGQDEEAQEQYLRAILEVARGYIEAENNPELLVLNIRTIFQSDQALLQSLVDFLPEGDAKALLQERI